MRIRATLRHDSTETTLAAERRLPRLANDPTDRIDPAEPMDPTESTEPIQPMESTEPTESMDRTEPCDRIDRTEPLPDNASAAGRIEQR